MSEGLTMYGNAGSVFPRIYEEIKALLQKELKGYCQLLIKNNPEMERALLSYLLEQDKYDTLHTPARKIAFGMDEIIADEREKLNKAASQAEERTVDYGKTTK